MSFLDLATLALHRRNELETRISTFVNKCDNAIDNIKKLKCQAQSFTQQMNCEPSRLKEQFLNCMKQLDEFTYIITDFNLSVETFNETCGLDCTPVLDTEVTSTILKPSKPNLIDILSEPVPSTSSACSNQCPPETPKPYKVPKKDQVLIQFSSNSCSTESVKNDKKETVQCGVSEISKDEESRVLEQCNLPAQTVLQTDMRYRAAIMHIDGGALWMLTENPDHPHRLMSEMTEYYKNSENKRKITAHQVASMTYCAYYDMETDSFYRGLVLGPMENNTVEVFLVDTGEVRDSSLDKLQPLVSQFCNEAPFARCCHLAGVDLLNNCNKDLMLKQEAYLSKYIGVSYDIEIEDNTSESLGIYIWLDSKRTLNDLLLSEGLAIAANCDGSVTSSQTKTSVTLSQRKASVTSSHGPPELMEEIDITDCPEHEDAVVAVTGYHNRDEAEICKHYKGGPAKTCFKGALCKKKHIQIHPEGWTLDRVEARARCPPPPPPAPGSWHRVFVTCVSHLDHVYVQYVEPKQDEPVRQFGVILPPNNLQSLIRDMNSKAARIAYKPLTLTPAPGELVAALYPLDDMWYRARVLSLSRTEQTIEVMYIDYGTVSWVQEDQVRVLEARHCGLGARAQLARLAGVRARGSCSSPWAAAKACLEDLTRDRLIEMHVISRDYDEITVELYDNGYNVAEQLAAADMVKLEPYSIEDDTQVTKKVVVP